MLSKIVLGIVGAAGLAVAAVDIETGYSRFTATGAAAELLDASAWAPRPPVRQVLARRDPVDDRWLVIFRSAEGSYDVWLTARCHLPAATWCYRQVAIRFYPAG